MSDHKTLEKASILTGEFRSQIIGPGSHRFGCSCNLCGFRLVNPIPTSDFYLVVEMAGTKKEDIKVSLKGTLLHITWNSYLGETKVQTHSLDKYYDTTAVDVNYRDGLLKVKVPRLKAVEESFIEVPIEIK